jgi:hypothetical protein
MIFVKIIFTNRRFWDVKKTFQLAIAVSPELSLTYSICCLACRSDGCSQILTLLGAKILLFAEKLNVKIFCLQPILQKNKFSNLLLTANPKARGNSRSTEITVSFGVRTWGH